MRFSMSPDYSRIPAKQRFLALKVPVFLVPNSHALLSETSKWFSKMDKSFLLNSNGLHSCRVDSLTDAGRSRVGYDDLTHACPKSVVLKMDASL